MRKHLFLDCQEFFCKVSALSFRRKKERDQSQKVIFFLASYTQFKFRLHGRFF